MKKMYGYIRVSTNKQGETTSLPEQQLAISKYALAHEMIVTEWFEEKRTAAKKGRPVFEKMLRQLRSEPVEGVITHKIDRSTRNVQDWAAISALGDMGFDVHFAHDNLDLSTRSGRLTADIMAMVASDYVRNLREEALKGIRGRLRQGLLPNYAPYGYINKGGGEVKQIDKKIAPLVVEAFEKYATGKYSMNELRLSLYKKGLANRRGNPITKSLFTRMLRNPFYIGLLRYKTLDEDMPGIHKPLISVQLFNQVQEKLGEKRIAKRSKHDHLFKTRIMCATCKLFLVGELQKGRVYYRCHRKSCPKTTVREDRMEAVIAKLLRLFRVDAEHSKLICRQIERSDNKEEAQTKKNALNMKIGKIKAKLTSLEDKYIADHIDHKTYLKHKNELTKSRVGLESELAKLAENGFKLEAMKAKFELCQNAYNTYKTSDKEGKRALLEMFLSNLMVGTDKRPMVKVNPAYFDYLNTKAVITCAQCIATSRTFCGNCRVTNKDVNANKVAKLLHSV